MSSVYHVVSKFPSIDLLAFAIQRIVLKVTSSQQSSVSILAKLQLHR
jgi:hypothetical protein